MKRLQHIPFILILIYSKPRILKSFFFFFSIILGMHPWHMEVSRLGVKSEIQLPAYTTTTAMWDPSCICDLHHSPWQHRPFMHWARPGIEPISSWVLVGFVNPWATMGTPNILLFSFSFLFFSFFFFYVLHLTYSLTCSYLYHSIKFTIFIDFTILFNNPLYELR